MISLVTTVLNDREGCVQFFEEMLRQTRRPEEIVIVDAGSRDGTWELLQAEGAAVRPWRLVALQEPRCNVARGRNLAIQSARHEVIVSTDIGCRWDPEWLRELAAPLLTDPACEAVMGSWRVVESNTRTLPDCRWGPSAAQCETIMRLFEDYYRRALQRGDESVAVQALAQARRWLRQCRAKRPALIVRKLLGYPTNGEVASFFKAGGTRRPNKSMITVSQPSAVMIGGCTAGECVSHRTIRPHAWVTGNHQRSPALGSVRFAC